jgi:hypothetical protein
MQQEEIKKLLENQNFRNNQNYIFWNKMKSKILSVNSIYKIGKLYMFSSFLLSVLFTFYIFFNLLSFHEAVNIILFVPIIISFIIFFVKIIPLVYMYLYYYFINNIRILISINNINYKKIVKFYTDKGWDFNEIIDDNFIIIKK